MKYWIITFFMSVCIINVYTQDNSQWDQTKQHHWKAHFKKVAIPSSADDASQDAYLYTSTSNRPKPLIVSLHTWSGTYSQKDPLTDEILARDWNYIHPDFRGKNNHPKAVGSPLAISDIEDAIQYALEHTNTDPNEVHIVGVSGGGYATLLAYMNINYPIKSFSAWVPISDIDAWYWESVGRKQKYADDILKAVSNHEGYNKEEALKRSPLWQVFPKEKRKNAKLFIYAGVHDGYTGSVPITHSILMYNRLVGELKHNTSDMDAIMTKASIDSALVSSSEIIGLLSKRTSRFAQQSGTLYGRAIHLKRNYNDIALHVFEGTHEQLPQALALIPYEEKSKVKYNILTIGDSNAQHKEGWSNQLREMLPRARVINISQSGRTIGFDNNNNQSLNALRNIESYLDSAQQQLAGQKLDVIVVSLGTNDTKSEFSEKQHEVNANLNVLLGKIKNHPLIVKSNSRLVYLSPPPIRKKDIEEKYKGGNERLAQLLPLFKVTAEKNGFTFVDVYSPLQGVLDYYAEDGVHMSKAGQEIITSCIVDRLEYFYRSFDLK